MFRLIKDAVINVGIAGFALSLIKSKFVLGMISGWVLILLLFATYRGHESNFVDRLEPVADRIAGSIASGIPVANDTGFDSVYIFPFKGPNGSVMADYIRDAVKETNKYSVVGSGIIENSLRFIQIDLPKMNQQEALEYGKKMGVGGVIVGKVEQIDAAVNPPVLAVSMKLVSVEDSEKSWPVYSYSPKSNLPRSNGSKIVGQTGEDKTITEINANSKGNRIVIPVDGNATDTVENGWIDLLILGLGFVVTSLFTPLILYPLTKHILSNETNLSTASLLGVYALINCVVLSIVVSINPLSAFGSAIIVVSFAVSLWLNYISCSFIERIRT